MNKIEIPYGLLVGLALLLSALAGCRESQCPANDQAMRLISIKGHTLAVETAATVAERACGLSQRPRLAANHGMLFVFRGDQIREFWMKDTLIPLSIAYLDADGRILNLHEMEPDDSEHRYRSSAPARYALETHRGWFRSKGIRVGDLVEFQLPPDLVID